MEFSWETPPDIASESLENGDPLELLIALEEEYDDEY